MRFHRNHNSRTCLSSSSQIRAKGPARTNRDLIYVSYTSTPILFLPSFYPAIQTSANIHCILPPTSSSSQFTLLYHCPIISHFHPTSGNIRELERTSERLWWVYPLCRLCTAIGYSAPFAERLVMTCLHLLSCICLPASGS
jgi:hypothetical protein